MSNFKIETAYDALANLIILAPSGKVTFESTAVFRDCIRESYLSNPISKMIIDMSGVRYIDSSGLGLLVAARNSLSNAKKRLIICCLDSAAKKTLSQTNLINYFEITETVDEAKEL
jgi:anti-anti-sigma factor